jgi:U3 small nucleolar RNA-associated protein 14
LQESESSSSEESSSEEDEEESEEESADEVVEKRVSMYREYIASKKRNNLWVSGQTKYRSHIRVVRCQNTG